MLFQRLNGVRAIRLGFTSFDTHLMVTIFANKLPSKQSSSLCNVSHKDCAFLCFGLSGRLQPSRRRAAKQSDERVVEMSSHVGEINRTECRNTNLMLFLRSINLSFDIGPYQRV